MATSTITQTVTEQPTTAVFEKVSQDSSISINEDQQYWWKHTGSTIASLLESSKYTAEQQEYYLKWYKKSLTASLGPRPIPGKKFLFGGAIVGDGSYVEPSVNWKENDKSKRLVRFTIGATNADDGTSADPFSEKETRRLLQAMKDDGIVPDLSFKQYDLFAKHLFISNPDEFLARKPEGVLPLSHWIGFDLKAGSPPLPKVYFLPVIKMLETGKHTNQLFYEIAEESGPEFAPALENVKSFIESFKGEQWTPDMYPYTELIAHDCTDTVDSRIKTYIRTGLNTLAGAKKLYTLDGRITNDEIAPGLEALAELWPLFHGLDPNDPDLENKPVYQGFGLGASVELKPGKSQPEVKIHFPTKALQMRDGVFCDNMAKFFRKRGHAEFADTFRADLEKAL